VKPKKKKIVEQPTLRSSCLAAHQEQQQAGCSQSPTTCGRELPRSSHAGWWPGLSQRALPATSQAGSPEEQALLRPPLTGAGPPQARLVTAAGAGASSPGAPPLSPDRPPCSSSAAPPCRQTGTNTVPFSRSPVQIPQTHHTVLPPRPNYDGRSSSCKGESSEEEESDTYSDEEGVLESFRWPPELLQQPRHHRSKRGERRKEAIEHAQRSSGWCSANPEGGGFNAANINVEGGRGATLLQDEVDEQRWGSGSGEERAQGRRRRSPSLCAPNGRPDAMERGGPGFLWEGPGVDESLGPGQAGCAGPAGGGLEGGTGLGHRAAPWEGSGAGEFSGRGWGTGPHAWPAMGGEQWWDAEDVLGEAQGFPHDTDFGIRHGTCEVTGGLRHARATLYHSVTQLSPGSFTDMLDSGTEEEGNANRGADDVNAVKYMYRDETWSQKFFTYDPKRIDFVGSRGTTQDFEEVPSVASLFDLFWPVMLLLKIVIETNRYASHPLDAMGNTMGGRNWVPITIPELKAFLAIHMYMDMKRQPNVQSYWAKEGSIFHCHTISNIMS
jgi:hypothetical protein